MSLSKIARLLAHVRWRHFPGTTVNRLDLASDHVLSAPPTEARDEIAALKLPYSHAWTGEDSAGRLWETVYHSSGRHNASSVVVAHYPRLEALWDRHPEASAVAQHYARRRLRQEVRLKADALRRIAGPGSVTPQLVFGSLPTIVDFAQRRLAPIYRAAILSPPPRDLRGESAIAASVN